MRGVFVDANESLAVIFERLQKPGDPEVRINRDPDISPEQFAEIAADAKLNCPVSRLLRAEITLDAQLDDSR